MSVMSTSKTTKPPMDEIPERTEADEQIEILISEISAEEIQSIAKTIIQLVMDQVTIGIPPKRMVPTGKKSPEGDLLNDLVALNIKETIDRDTFEEAAIPLLTSQLENAFSLSAEFIASGLTIDIADENGLLDRIAEQYPEYKTCLTLQRAKVLNRLFPLAPKKHKVYQVILKLNVEASKEQSKLFFLLQEANSSHNYSLEQFTATENL